jgi:hypothetical protein
MGFKVALARKEGGAAVGGNMSEGALRSWSPAPAALLLQLHQANGNDDEGPRRHYHAESVPRRPGADSGADPEDSGADSEEEPQTRVWAEGELVSSAAALRSRLAAKMRRSSPAAQNPQHLNLGSVCRKTLKCAGADVDNDDDATVSCNEEDALMSKGTVCSESSCDTELSAKETPRNSTGEAFLNKFKSTRKNENATVSEEVVVPLANIREADTDDWEEWEMQALREQQEQIAKDCRLLAELEEQRLRKNREAQEQLEISRFLAQKSQRIAEMQRMATVKIGGVRTLVGEEVGGKEDEEVIIVKQTFVQGMRVRIHSLQRHFEMNGMEAVVTELTGDRVQVQIGDGRLLAFKSDNLKPYSDVENSSPSHSKIKRPMSAPAARCANKEKDRTAAKGHLGLKNFNFFAKRSSKVGVLPLEEVHANDCLSASESPDDTQLLRVAWKRDKGQELRHHVESRSFEFH